MNTQLSRLLKADKNLSCQTVAEIMELGRRSVERMCAMGQIGCRHIHIRSTGERRKTTYHIPRISALRWLVRNSVGDERTELLRDIEQHAPKWLETAKRAAESADEAAQAQAAENRPSNVIPIFGHPPKKRRSSQSDADPYAGHPDLFGAA